MKTKFMLLRQTNNPSNQNEGIRPKMKFYFMFLFIVCSLTQLASAQTVPDAPSITSAAPGVKSAFVYFTPPANNGGARIDNYEYSIDGGTTWVTRLPESTSSPMEIIGLTECSEYSVIIRAVNSSGSGTASTAATVTPRDGKGAGKVWTSQTYSPTVTPVNITYGNGLFVAAAKTGGVVTSPDGITWTKQLTPSGDWLSVTWGNNLFVAVGFSGKVMTSPNGINWTLSNTSNLNTWRAVTYGNGLFVAVSISGIGNRVMTSPDGINWTARTSAADNNWYSVIYGNGLFVAVAEQAGTNAVMTSPDGFTWTLQNTPAGLSNYQWYSVTYGNGLFVAVSVSGSPSKPVMTSPDGITWTAIVAPPNGWTSVTFGNGLFVAVSTTGSGNRVMTSPDGVNWTSGSSAADLNWRGITYGNQKFVAVASLTGNGVMTSENLLTPDKPVINSITPGTDNLSIHFTAPSDGGGSAISNYEYSTDNGSSWVTLSPTTTSSPITITGLTPSTEYQVQLRAVNAQGFGCPSETMTTTTNSNSFSMTLDIECPNTTFNADPKSGFTFTAEQQSIINQLYTDFSTNCGCGTSESALFWFSTTTPSIENAISDVSALTAGTYYLRFGGQVDGGEILFSEPITVTINGCLPDLGFSLNIECPNTTFNADPNSGFTFTVEQQALLDEVNQKAFGGATGPVLRWYNSRQVFVDYDQFFIDAENYITDLSSLLPGTYYLYYVGEGFSDPVVVTINACMPEKALNFYIVCPNVTFNASKIELTSLTSWQQYVINYLYNQFVEKSCGTCGLPEEPTLYWYSTATSTTEIENLEELEAGTYYIRFKGIDDGANENISDPIVVTIDACPSFSLDIECPNLTFDASDYTFTAEQQAHLDLVWKQYGYSGTAPSPNWFSAPFDQASIIEDIASLQPGTYYLRIPNEGYSNPVVVTINTPSGTNTTTVAACNSYTWKVDGETYTESGTYSSTASCGTEVLILTITSGTTQTITTSACLSYTWSVTGETYTQTGVYSKTTECDTEILDLTITTPPTWYKDSDNDGYSDGTTLTQCDQPAGYKLSGTLSSTTGDCNDSDALINPGETEVCNGIDDDCDGQIDEGFTDTDGDGTKDCVDTDDDGDGTLDANDCAPLDATKWRNGSFYADNDGDVYGSGSLQTLCYGTSTPTGYVGVAGDCNDNNAAIRPNATEVCGDGIDNNCNGQIDEGCVISCKFSTFSQGGWATRNNPLTMSSFSSKFPIGLYIGAPGRSIRLNSVDAVRAFLPNSGTAARLTKDLVNPTNKSLKNTFAGQLAAMRLNMAYNPGLAEATIVSTDAYNGWTVQRLFDEANSKISSATAVSSSVLSSLSGACEKVNLSYHQGAVSGYVQCNPTSSSVKNNMTTLGITSTSVKEQTNSIGSHELSMDVFGNPTSNAFTIKVNSNKFLDVSMRVTDINGRVREVRVGLKNGQTVQFGSVFESGLYIVELTQEDKRVIQKLVKLK